MGWQFLEKTDELPTEGMVKSFMVKDTPVALYQIDGEYFATHNICTHQTALLSEGFVEDGTIECPLHQGVFDIRSGKALTAPVTCDIQTFLVKKDDKGVWINLAESAIQVKVVDKGTSETIVEKTDMDSKLSLQNFVIIGGGQAAASAVMALHQNGFGGKIHIISDEWYLPYERPPLSKDILLGRVAPDSSQILSREKLVQMNVTFHANQTAQAINNIDKCVSFGDNKTLNYDKLLIVTGASPRQLPIVDMNSPAIYQLRSLDDAIALKKILCKDLRIGIIGGGFIGLEVASALCELGGKPIIIEAHTTLLSRVLHPRIAMQIGGQAEKCGSKIITNAQTKKVTQTSQGLVIEFEQGSPLEVDAILVGIGSIPNSQIAESANIKCINGGIIVDSHGQTSVADIYAAGDVAVWSGNQFHSNPQNIRLESWQNANEQPAIAARHMMGETDASYNIQPWFLSDQFGTNIQMVGLSSPDDEMIIKDLPSGRAYYMHDGKKFTALVACNAPATIRNAKEWLAHGISLESLQAKIANNEPNSEPPKRKKTRKNGVRYKTKLKGNANMALADYYVWPKEGLTRIPDWVYTDDTIYENEVEKIFHGKTWNYVALEAEIPNEGDFKKSFVGPTPVVVTRAAKGEIHVFENRCSHRAAEFCREHSGNVTEFVCPYHQWSYDLEGNLAGVPFRRGVNGKGGMPKDFSAKDHGLKKLNVTTRRGVIFASFDNNMPSLEDYLSPEILTEFDATFDGRKLVLLGYYRNTLPGNWKLYHENLKDPYHATLLHTFLVSFGLLVAGNRSQMLCDPTGRHGVMASAKQDGTTVEKETQKEMRAYVEGMTLKDPRLMDYVEEFDSPWSVTMQTIWPNMIIQREMNTLGIRQIVPQGPNEFIMNWTMFGFEGDTQEMTEHRLRQGNLMGPSGFLGFEDNEAMKYVQDGMLHTPESTHVVELDPQTNIGTADTLISESSIRAMYQHWRQELEL